MQCHILARRAWWASESFPTSTSSLEALSCKDFGPVWLSLMQVSKIHIGTYKTPRAQTSDELCDNVCMYRNFKTEQPRPPPIL